MVRCLLNDINLCDIQSNDVNLLVSLRCVSLGKETFKKATPSEIHTLSDLVTNTLKQLKREVDPLKNPRSESFTLFCFVCFNHTFLLFLL